MTQWVEEPYSSANFRGVLQTGVDVAWSTQDQFVTVKYLMLQPDTMLVDFTVQGSVITSDPLWLFMKVPGGYQIADDSSTSLIWWENGYGDAGVGRLAADTRDYDWLRMTKIPSYRPSPAVSNTWIPSTGTYTMGQIIFRVQHP